MADLPPRITLRRVKGWRLPEGARVVTRATIFGNPYQAGTPGKWNVPCMEARAGWEASYHMNSAVNAQMAVMFFSAWLHNADALAYPPATLTRLGRDTIKRAMSHRRDLILSRLPELRGRPLACTCKPGEPCHADVLIELANSKSGPRKEGE